MQTKPSILLQRHEATVGENMEVRNLVQIWTMDHKKEVAASFKYVWTF